VPRVEREASVVWEGSSAKGRGAISAASSAAFTGLPYTEPTRVGAPEGHTSPEELLAAAHGACFAMSLAAELTRARTRPERLDVHARVVLDEVEGRGHLVVASELTVRGRVPGSDPASFEATVAAADEACTFSNLIKASATVTIDAILEG
jgi:lipoyl-dependent peroxiredoxin